ncbi:hypothetical protein F4818DRAFT_439192 [Hypoxylon cercidicola]|nr:hypothetical protein F4818DRAFT_439192 [Hypoxylon cercidicola]
MAPDDRGPQLAAVTLSFLGLAALTVALRCYVRLCLLKVFQVEDWLAIASMACFIGYAVDVMLCIEYGAGKHLAAVPVEQIPLALKHRWIGELTYVVTSMFTKFAVGLFLLRICSRAWQRSVIWTTLLVCLIYHVFYVFMTAFQCQPASYYWLKYNPGTVGKCWSDELVMGCTYAAAAINATTDWILGLLPIALVQNLELSKRTKVLVSCTLALGSIASTATIVRIPYIWQLTQPGDFLYEFTDLTIWSTIEIGLGIVASAVATLRPLVRAVFGGLSSFSSRYSRRSHPIHYSWRKSGTVAARRSGGPDHQGYYRMGSWRKDSDAGRGGYGNGDLKTPERVRYTRGGISNC